MHNLEGTIITRNIATAAGLAETGWPLVLRFQETSRSAGILALHSIPKHEPIENMALLKLRDKKPVVTTQSPDKAEEFFNRNSGIATDVPQAVIDSAIKAFSTSITTGRPLGFLLPADPDAKLPPRLIGHNLVSIAGRTLPNTVGFMVSGGICRDYDTLVRRLGTPFASTSWNFSGDQRDGNSGLPFFGAGLAQFAGKRLVAVVPPARAEKLTPSTTLGVIYPNIQGEWGFWLGRQGSTPVNEFIDIGQQSGLRYLGPVDQVRVTKPYDFSGYNLCQARLFELWVRVKTAHGKDLLITPSMAHGIQQRIVPQNARF